VTYPGLSCDESPYILAAARHAGIEPVLLPNQESAISEFELQAARYRDFPGYPVPNSFFGTVAPAAARRGCRVLFSGYGGDECFSGEAASLADAMLELDAPRLLRELAWVAAWQEISRGRAFLRHALKPSLRQAALAAGLLRPRPPQLPWLAPAWVARIRLLERMRDAPPQPAGGSGAQAGKYAWALNTHNAHEYEMADRLTSGAGIEYRHPLLDRRLIEFAFAVPAALHFSGGRSKSLLRRAMRELLPAAVLERREGGDFSIVTCRAIDRVLAGRPAREWTAVRAGWVEPAPLMAAYAAARAGLGAGTSFSGNAVWRAWMAHGVGVTLDALAAPQARRIAKHQG